MEKQEGTGAPWLKRNHPLIGLLGDDTAKSEEASRLEKEKQLEKEAVETVHALGGAMPSEGPTMTSGPAMERLETIKADAYKLTATQFARNYDDLIQINTMLVMEVLQLREKCDQLMLEIFKTTWTPNTGHGDFAMAGNR